MEPPQIYGKKKHGNKKHGDARIPAEETSSCFFPRRPGGLLSAIHGNVLGGCLESGVVPRICGKRCGQSPFRFDLIVRFAKHRNMCLRLNRNLHFKKNMQIALACSACSCWDSMSISRPKSVF